MNDRLVSPPDAPVLVVKTEASDQTLRAGTWLIDIALMVLLSLVFTVITWRRLVRLGPGRKRR